MFEELKTHIRENAEREGKSILSMFLSRLSRFVFAIPGLILVLLCPIKSGEAYDWYSGIWHGWFAICNMIIHLFSPETLYIAPNATFSYNICWWIFLLYGSWFLLVLVFFKLNEWPWSIFSNTGKQVALNARYEGHPVWKMLMLRFAGTLSLTIPGFVIVLLYPINAGHTYGWFSGIWHGWFALCNMTIGLFSKSTLYIAPNGTVAYNVCWWIFCVWGILTLFGILFYNFLLVKANIETKLLSPIETTADNHSMDDVEPVSSENKTSIPNRIIKVFISSTFQDMHKERDYLMVQVFPQLQEMAQKRNVKFIPIDLRWGVTEEESRSGKVLELCLQEIDNSIPFFIGIIGKRYGWQPSIEDFSKSDLLKERYPWIETDFKQGLSITEIEMQYGVLRRKERINAVFFTTQGAADASIIFANNDEGRIANLKRQIIKDGRYPIVTVYSPEDFGNRILDLFTKYLDKYFPVVSSDDAEPSSDEDQYLDSENYIPCYLKKYGKKLSKQQMDLILNHPFSKNRTALKSLLDELLLFGKYEELDSYIHYLLEAQTPVALYEKILERAERQYGAEQVKTFFSVLRVSEKGMRVKDILEIAEVEDEELTFDLDFSIKGLAIFVSYIGKAFWTGITGSTRKKPFNQFFREYLEREEDGKIRLSHEYMAKAIDQRYLLDKKTLEKYRKMVKAWKV